MKRTYVNNLTLCAMFISLGLVLPFFTGQIPRIGNMLLPMHLPIFLCGLICGAKWGLFAGFVTPLLRTALFGMPILYPMSVSMAFELATYGFVAGLLYTLSRWKCIIALYRAMIPAMFAGRLVWGTVRVVLTGIFGTPFSWEMFCAGAFLNAVPGIVLQLILIPAIMVALNKTGLVPFSKHHKSNTASEH